jgi:hypothetical protein
MSDNSDFMFDSATDEWYGHCVQFTPARFGQMTIMDTRQSRDLLDRPAADDRMSQPVLPSFAFPRSVDEGNKNQSRLSAASKRCRASLVAPPLRRVLPAAHGIHPRQVSYPLLSAVF